MRHAWLAASAVILAAPAAAQVPYAATRAEAMRLFWTVAIALVVIAALAGYALIRLRYWLYGRGPWRSPHLAWRDRVDIIVMILLLVGVIIHMLVARRS